VEAEGPDGPQLGTQLRRLRELAGVSGRELAQRIGISQSTVSRIEAGRSVPSLPVVAAWALEVDASVETRERLALLTEALYSEVNPWRAMLGAGGHVQGDIQEQEEQARHVRVFQPSVVPGLLQTAEYARRVFSLSQVPHAGDDLAAAVAARLQRQVALYRDDKQFDFLVTEAALRWRPGLPKLLLAQLHQIMSVNTLDNVSIGLIPLEVEARTFMSHGFVIYDVEDEVALVSVDTIHANVVVRTAEDVDLYRQRWSLLSQMAVFGEDADKFLARVAADVRATAGD
jgi:transcriptional regulator with XRE-family HTH domain